MKRPRGVATFCHATVSLALWYVQTAIVPSSSVQRMSSSGSRAKVISFTPEAVISGQVNVRSEAFQPFVESSKLAARILRPSREAKTT